MSFLNPVSEPVKRFSSTDADAPQINYNARVAGDVKTVLKACLVTGYGATASAGWTVANETATVAEFVSPSAAMSDYRLGVDDTSTSSTTWYYQYQNAIVNPSYNSPGKSFANVDKTHASNGWQLFITSLGIVFVEIVYHTAVGKLSTRITYIGQVKSALNNTSGKNIMFFNVGHSATIGIINYFFNSTSYIHLNLETNTLTHISSATANALSAATYKLDTSLVDLVSPIYLSNSTKDCLIGELPPFLSKLVNKSSNLYGVSDFTLDGRGVVSVCAGFANATAATANERSFTMLIRTDYWEY
ncbi:hypothetical protein [Psychrobacter sp. AT9]|uniref:hypothetical protein n=1 Tax=Psychrobacter sp. AT9 TaxID=3242893 RepID=UPI0039A4911A